jgi:hypothetical protein
MEDLTYSLQITAQSAVETAAICYRQASKDCRKVYAIARPTVLYAAAFLFVTARACYWAGQNARVWCDRLVAESLKPAPTAKVTSIAPTTDTIQTESEAALLDELIAATTAPAPVASAALAMSKPAVAVVEPIAPEAPSTDYTGMTVTQLRAIAKDRGIRTRIKTDGKDRRLNRSELLSALA